MSILKLTLNKAAFDVMVTGEKKEEYRVKSKWIMSRLWKQDKTKLPLKFYYRKHYDFVEFTNGYGKARPKFTAHFIDFLENLVPFEKTYSNGLKVKVNPTDQIIRIGEIVSIENFKE